MTKRKRDSGDNNTFTESLLSQNNLQRNEIANVGSNNSNSITTQQNGDLFSVFNVFNQCINQNTSQQGGNTNTATEELLSVDTNVNSNNNSNSITAQQSVASYNIVQKSNRKIAAQYAQKAKNISTNNINDKDHNGDTLLHLALRSKSNLATHTLIIEKGASIDIANNKDETARDVMIARYHECIEKNKKIYGIFQVYRNLKVGSELFEFLKKNVINVLEQKQTLPAINDDSEITSHVISHDDAFNNYADLNNQTKDYFDIFSSYNNQITSDTFTEDLLSQNNLQQNEIANVGSNNSNSATAQQADVQQTEGYFDISSSYNNQITSDTFTEDLLSQNNLQQNEIANVGSNNSNSATAQQADVQQTEGYFDISSFYNNQITSDTFTEDLLSQNNLQQNEIANVGSNNSNSITTQQNGDLFSVFNVFNQYINQNTSQRGGNTNTATEELLSVDTNVNSNNNSNSITAQQSVTSYNIVQKSNRKISAQYAQKAKDISTNNINDKDHNGDTLLHLALRSKSNLATHTLIIEKGASIDIANNNGETALNYMIARYYECIEKNRRIWDIFKVDNDTKIGRHLHKFLKKNVNNVLEQKQTLPAINDDSEITSHVISHDSNKEKSDQDSTTGQEFTNNNHDPILKPIISHNPDNETANFLDAFNNAAAQQVTEFDWWNESGESVDSNDPDPLHLMVMGSVDDELGEW